MLPVSKEQFLGQFEQEYYTITKKYIPSALENIRLYHTRYTPREPTRTICIIHGFGEHSGRFSEIAHFWATHNFEVLLIDMTGFGYSGGARGCATVEILANDVIKVMSLVRPDLPLFLYAHSLGGLTIVKLLLARPSLPVSGCIITSPLLEFPRDRKMSFMKIFMINQIGDELEDLIGNAMVNPTALTKNNKFMFTIFEDRLMIPFLSIKMAKSILNTLRWVQARFGEFKYPAMVFHGKKDTVVNYQGSHNFVYGKLMPYKKLQLYENGYHELQHDEEKDDLLEKAFTFIEQLPNYVIRPAGNINYSDLALSPPAKKKNGALVVKILIALGILIFILRRFRRK